MKNKKLTVTVGIPAFNEASNISVLLSSILLQIESNFKIIEIIVVSDGSTDNTALKVKLFKDPRIRLINNKIRRGQIFCQNLIFSQSKTNAVLILEADTYLEDPKYLAKLAKDITSKPEVGIVQGNFYPIPSHSIIGKIINSQQIIFKQVIIEADLAEKKLCSGRGGRLFNKNVYQNLRWPINVPEDIYSLFWCEQRNVPIFFEKSALVYFKIPETITDLIRERQKINSAKNSISRHFNRQRVDDFFNLTQDFKSKMFFIFFLEKPLYCLLYSIINFYVNAKLSKKSFTDFWPITQSTKLLYRST